MKKIILLSILAIALTGCHTAKKTAKNDTPAAPAKPQNNTAPAAAAVPSPPTYIYKTRNDYSQNVFVGYANNRITFFPAPSDLYTNGKLATPTPLRNGYWLDNRGISPNIAFLSYTYEEYANMQHVPDDLYQRILDKDPILEMWDCGPRHTYNDAAKELNKIIQENQLDTRCTRVK
jgi:hypothetical protein